MQTFELFVCTLPFDKYPNSTVVKFSQVWNKDLSVWPWQCHAVHLCLASEHE